MLLRSSSTPIKNSWVPEIEPVPKLSRNRSVSLTGAFHVNLPQSPNEELTLTRSPSESEQRESSPVAKKKLLFDTGNQIQPVQEVGPTGLDTGDGSCAVVGRSDSVLQSLIMGGISSGNGGGKIFSGGSGGGRGSNGGYGSESYDDDGNNNHGNESTDAYYQKMIDANPGNALLLANYAKFLKEICRDSMKAEEYCSRALLVNPSDANVLSMYGDLIWANQKDAERAGTYFDQAVKTSPDDSYVLASYARFLWDAEEEEDEEEEDQLESERNKVSSQPSFFKESSTSIIIT